MNLHVFHSVLIGVFKTLFFGDVIVTTLSKLPFVLKERLGLIIFIELARLYLTKVKAFRTATILCENFTITNCRHSVLQHQIRVFIWAFIICFPGQSAQSGLVF